MKKLTTQTILAIIIVSGFILVTGIIAIYGYANDIKVDTEKTLTHLQGYSQLFTGIIGVIIGYYFGKSGSKTKDTTDN